ncbi:MAG: hypothetical protein Unbinned6437contig1000_9 [Prokaryotic dsDNA virus sp.]|nr:MAG: hypothetical protein Unbinned6437contig1000_9 [Prokaryotic dsDNA virus sp.]|tara:strand:+ start:40350 stop:40643 length:294 start_codon:yes stop_codon:yes gene_type:complete
MNITKGNWYAVENDYYIDIKVDGNPIAQVIENEFVGTDKNTMRANAKIMECAPEMREMLVKISEAINSGLYEIELADAITQFGGDIENLLAKSRGES